jgi:ribosomal protein L37AE/L43A
MERVISRQFLWYLYWHVGNLAYSTNNENNVFYYLARGKCMTCPRCGSMNVQAISEYESETQGYGCCKGLLGYLIFGPIGWLCGLCGMGGQRTTTKVLWVCNNCGNKFR